MKVKTLIKIGILSALSLFLMLIVQLPIIFSAPFLKYDFGNIPPAIASFALGPLEAVIIVLLRDLIFLTIRSSPVELIGVPMDFLASSIFVITAGLIYRIKKNKFMAVLSLAIATLVMTFLMVPVNYFVYPVFIKFFSPHINLNFKELIYFIVWIVSPFNLLKGTINSIIVFWVYKKASPFLKKN